MGWFQKLLAAVFRRTPAKPPRTGNGASSFHLRWQVPAGAAIRSASVTLQVDADPRVESLYFWALQASFSDAAGEFGGAHVGLQWNPRFPGSRAVNWGGYHDQRFGGAVLDGTDSPLRSSPNDRNTRDYPWQAGRGYRFRIEPGSEAGLWRGLVTDLVTSETVAIRQLRCRGDRLTGLQMWSEVFADCDAPSVTIRWSDLTIERTDGTTGAVTAAEARYQSAANGGCANTDAAVDGAGFTQKTTTERRTGPGTTLSI